jgi:imidazolonepropionase-like amidohydrolase
MASGGASPNDPIGFPQFSLEEMQAIVEEAEAVMAHAYTSRAIERALRAGVYW